MSKSNFASYCLNNQRFILHGSDEHDYISHDREWVGQRNTKEEGTIMSVKGTVRGVKNRVKAGIASFLQDQNRKVKNS